MSGFVVQVVRILWKKTAFPPFLILIIALFSQNAYSEKEKVVEDFAKDEYKLHYELHGAYEGLDGNGNPIGVEIGIFRHRFKIGFLPGGLPPKGTPSDTINGEVQDSVVIFQADGFDVVCDGKTVKAETEKFGIFEIPKVQRISPSLGAPVPDGGVSLFDGSGLDEWEEGAVLVSKREDGTPLEENVWMTPIVDMRERYAE